MFPLIIIVIFCHYTYHKQRWQMNSNCLKETLQKMICYKTYSAWVVKEKKTKRLKYNFEAHWITFLLWLQNQLFTDSFLFLCCLKTTNRNLSRKKSPCYSIHHGGSDLHFIGSYCSQSSFCQPHMHTQSCSIDMWGQCEQFWVTATSNNPITHNIKSKTHTSSHTSEMWRRHPIPIWTCLLLAFTITDRLTV